VREVVEPAEQSAFLGLDRRLGVSLEERVAAAPEPLMRILAADPIKVPDLPPPVDKVEQPLSYHFSQWTMPSRGIRVAGLNSPPVLKPMVSSATWLYRS